MTSNELSGCCTTAVEHGGEPTGSMITIGKTAAYLATPARNKDSKLAIIFLSDGFGIFRNGVLLADRYAKAGYLTVLPDLFEGDPFPFPRPADFNLKAWITEGAGGRGHGTNIVDPIIESTLAWLRNERGVEKIGGVGYCFGGKYVARFLRPGLIDVGFIAHPANIQLEEVAAVNGPLSIAAADDDWVFPPEKRHESEDLLRKNKHGVSWQLTVYTGVEHDFAVRTDRTVRSKRWAMDQSFEQAKAWMVEYLDEE